jgi:phospholipid/cholesterol/gamma-HCH transport system substrate-binding protein
MKNKTPAFLLGLFVTIGVLLAAGLIIWIGASKYFQKGKTYITFFDESVQGLQVDSSVKYRGVEVGRVHTIRVAPDYKLVEVVMKINLEGPLQKDTISQLKAAGITGLVFIELDRRRDGDLDKSPEITFGTEYPLIPSKPSELRELILGIDAVIVQIKQIDFKGISDQTIRTGKSIEDLMSSPKVKQSLVHIESIASHIDNVTERIDQISQQGKIDAVFTEAGSTLAEIKGLAAKMKEELQNMKLSETSVKTGRMIEGLDRRSKAITLELKITSEHLRKTSEELELLVDRLKANPSDLIFGSPPALERKD